MNKVNDLVFKEVLKRGYNLEGQTRVWNLADSKLWHLTPKQAQGFLDLELMESYKKSIIDKEVHLIKEYMEPIIKNLSEKQYNIIDLGCGNGKKAAIFIKDFSKFVKVRYCPIDISSYMVSKAAKTIKSLKLGEVIEFKWNISDFENLSNITPLLRESNFKNHFLLLLGNTLGNFDRDDILNGIKQSMKKNDYILIGNGLNSSNQEEALKAYKNTFIEKFLVRVINHIGLSNEDVSYEVRFKDSRVEMIYILKKDKTVSYLNKKIRFYKGDFIITAVSYKYSKEEFQKILSKFFKDVKIYTDTEKTYALALCKK